MYDINGDPLYAAIRPDILEAMNRYGQEYRAVGHFLTAVLENDLAKALSGADQYNRETIWPIVMYVYNQMPSACHGSKEKVKAWLEQYKVAAQAAEFAG